MAQAFATEILDDSLRGDDGLHGGGVTVVYTFSSATADADPGNGILRLSSATQNTSTVIRADDVDGNGANWRAVILTLANALNSDTGFIRIVDADDLTKWILWNVTQVSQPTGYSNVTGTVVASSEENPFTDSQQVVLLYSKNGRPGANGVDGQDGSDAAVTPGSTDNAIVRADGTNNDTIQGSTASIDDLGALTLNADATHLSPILDVEELSSSNWTSTGWTGDFDIGFTHTPGNTTPLTNTLAADNATTYAISFTMTGRTAGSITITFGGQTSRSMTGTDAFGPISTSTGTLSITPSSTFDGTLTNISIRKITGGSSPQLIMDDGNGPSLEIRGLGSNGTSIIRRNVMVGDACGQQIIGARSNVGVGFESFEVLTSGLNNVAIGDNTLSALTVGQNNTAVGSAAGASTTIGNGNLFFGSLAGFGMTSASNNVCIGENTGRSITTGNSNLFFGRSAGFSGSQLATATGSIAIGNNTFTDASNQIVLGSTSITQTLLRGTVDVLNGTAAQALNVYNTFTSSSNFERLGIAFSTDVAKIQTEKGASGTARALDIGTDSTARISISSDGKLNVSGANLSSTDPLVAGELWNDSGTLKVSAG